MVLIEKTDRSHLPSDIYAMATRKQAQLHADILNGVYMYINYK